MSDITTIFGGITVADIVAYGTAVGALIGFGVKSWKFMTKIHDDQKEKAEQLQKICEDIQVLKEDSVDTKELINVLTEQQRLFSARQDEIESQNKTRAMNELRDRLLQSYRYYTNQEKNPMLAWSEMEKEAFDELFSDYEKMGGNGFMHSTVQPAMAKLTVVSMFDTAGFANLMASRRG